MRKIFMLAGAMTLLFFAFASNGSARIMAVSSVIPHCNDVSGCTTVGYDLGSKRVFGKSFFCEPLHHEPNHG